MNSLFKYTFLLFFIISSSFAQTDWVDYVVRKNKGIMSVSVDLDFIDYKPNYKNLLILATHYKDCMNNGFPKQKGLEDLYAFSDSTALAINKLTKNKLVGLMTYQCIGFDIYYVKDTVGIRENLNKIFDKRFESTTNYIIINRDSKWKYYIDNLYPNDVSDEFFADQRFLLEMVAEGDDLNGKRKVNHWVYFNNIKKREKYKRKLEELEFSIDSINYKKEKRYPYELQFSREDFVFPIYISTLSKQLQELAYSLHGIYEGWGTEIKKED